MKKMPRQAQVSWGESMSQQDIEKTVIQELIRLCYIGKMGENLSVDILQTVLDMCGLFHGFPPGREINREFWTSCVSLNPDNSHSEWMARRILLSKLLASWFHCAGR